MIPCSLPVLQGDFPPVFTVRTRERWRESSQKWGFVLLRLDPLEFQTLRYVHIEPLVFFQLRSVLLPSAHSHGGFCSWASGLVTCDSRFAPAMGLQLAQWCQSLDGVKNCWFAICLALFVLRGWKGQLPSSLPVGLGTRSPAFSTFWIYVFLFFID